MGSSANHVGPIPEIQPPPGALFGSVAPRRRRGRYVRFDTEGSYLIEEHKAANRDADLMQVNKEQINGRILGKCPWDTFRPRNSVISWALCLSNSCFRLSNT